MPPVNNSKIIAFKLRGVSRKVWMLSRIGPRRKEEAFLGYIATAASAAKLICPVSTRSANRIQAATLL